MDNLSNALNRIVVPKGDLNELRWAGSPGRYEVYYLTLNLPPDRLGLWLRYTVDAPLGQPAYCELWAHAFDPAAPEASLGLKNRFAVDRLSRPLGALVGVDGAVLAEGRAEGAVRQGGREIAWSLSFVPSKTAVSMTPAAFRAIRLASSSMILANPDVRFEGTVTIDGRTRSVRDAPGCQVHMWGKKRQERWAWGQCNDFDGRRDCAIQGVAVYLKRMGRVRGPLTSVYVRYRGEDFCLNALPQMLLARSDIAFPSWRFEGAARGHRFVGVFRSSPERMVQVTYQDPDGEKSFCCNTEIADLSLQVYRGDVKVDELLATGSAHLEFADRAQRPDVRHTV